MSVRLSVAECGFCVAATLEEVSVAVWLWLNTSHTQTATLDGSQTHTDFVSVVGGR